MKNLNDYTFRCWYNGTEKDVETTVQAETVAEAYEKIYSTCCNSLSRDDIELIKASIPLVWEVWVCDVDEIPGADWIFCCESHTQDAAENVVELELSERRVSYAFMSATATQVVPKELLETGVIRLSDAEYAILKRFDKDDDRDNIENCDPFTDFIDAELPF